jgi:hypothetical protein
VLGGGHGLASLGAQELTDRITPPENRAQIFSAFQLGLYIDATAPAVAVGFIAGRVGLTAATPGELDILGATLRVELPLPGRAGLTGRRTAKTSS